MDPDPGLISFNILKSDAARRGPARVPVIWGPRARAFSRGEE